MAAPGRAERTRGGLLEAAGSPFKAERCARQAQPVLSHLMGVSCLPSHFCVSCMASLEMEGTLSCFMQKLAVGPLPCWFPRKFKPLKNSGGIKTQRKKMLESRKMLGEVAVMSGRR